MKTKLVAIALLSIGMAGAPLAGAFAQDNGAGGSGNTNGGSGASDAAPYLSGPNIQNFYNHEDMSELRSSDEMATTYKNMNSDDQAKLKAACLENQDPKFTDLCNAVKAM